MDSRPVTFKPLPLSRLRPGTGYRCPYFNTPRLVNVSAYALEVMTDLHFVPAAVTLADADVEAATLKMISRSVRSLLVTDVAGDIVGIITSRDLMGDKPHQVMQRERLTFAEIKVRDIMTPADEIEVISLNDVLHAHVGDIVMTLRNSGRQHALVVEEDTFADKPMIRGMFSASQIARQLGIALEQHELSQTFAEIDRAIQTGARPMKQDTPSAGMPPSQVAGAGSLARTSGAGKG